MPRKLKTLKVPCEFCGRQAITDTAAARLLGVTREMVRQWRTGTVPCADHQYEKLAPMLGPKHRLNARLPSMSEHRAAEIKRLWAMDLKTREIAAIMKMRIGSVRALARRHELPRKQASGLVGAAWYQARMKR